MSLAKKVALGALLVLLLLLAGAVAAALALGIPRNAAGMAARSVCSAAFVAGRAPEAVFAADVRPASPALAVVQVSADPATRSVRGSFAGLFERTARHLGDRGCVLDVPAGLSTAGAPAAASTAPTASAAATAPTAFTASTAPTASAASPASTAAAASVSSAASATSMSAAPAANGPAAQRTAARPWPEGNRALEPAQWNVAGDVVDTARLQAVVERAFVGSGDPRAANARAVAVLHQGRLLVNRQASGFDAETPLHGWSMTKTVTAMLLHKRMAERGLDPTRRVVDSFGPGAGGRPAWAAAWQADGRAAITLDDLLFMRDGLGNEESYAATGAVPRMLFGATDVAAHAAAAPAEAPAGARWRYLSASTNIAARVLRSHFDSDAAYWAWPRQALFEPIGAASAVLETDTDGTWIGSSYLWASSGDWARLGQLLLDDGRWNGRAVLPPGLLARVARPAQATGEGHGYGWHAWRIGAPEGGQCAGQVPPDTLAMRGHWGQIVAVVPSRRTVIVRLGWTFSRAQFDGCTFVRDVLAALR